MLRHTLLVILSLALAVIAAPLSKIDGIPKSPNVVSRRDDIVLDIPTSHALKRGPAVEAIAERDEASDVNDWSSSHTDDEKQGEEDVFEVADEGEEKRGIRKGGNTTRGIRKGGNTTRGIRKGGNTTRGIRKGGNTTRGIRKGGNTTRGIRKGGNTKRSLVTRLLSHFQV